MEYIVKTTDKEDPQQIKKVMSQTRKTNKNNNL
jgi:hypothetical protein